MSRFFADTYSGYAGLGEDKAVCVLIGLARWHSWALNPGHLFFFIQRASWAAASYLWFVSAYSLYAGHAVLSTSLSNALKWGCQLVSRAVLSVVDRLANICS